MATLQARLEELSSALSDAERENLKVVLSMAAGELILDEARSPADGLAGEALESAKAALSVLHARTTEASIFRGRLSFLQGDTFNQLDAESRAMRPLATRVPEHFVAMNTPVALTAGDSAEFRDFLEPRVGPVGATGRTSYLYYESEGDRVDPHVDTDEFSLNVITMLEHNGRRESKLVLHPAGADPIDVFLEPGESIALMADRITHQRTPLNGSEHVRMVAFGFHLT